MSYKLSSRVSNKTAILIICAFIFTIYCLYINNSEDAQISILEAHADRQVEVSKKAAEKAALALKISKAYTKTANEAVIEAENAVKIAMESQSEEDDKYAQRVLDSALSDATRAAAIQDYTTEKSLMAQKELDRHIALDIALGYGY